MIEYRLDDWGSIPSMDMIFPFTLIVQTGCGNIQLLIKQILRVSSPEIVPANHLLRNDIGMDGAFSSCPLYAQEQQQFYLHLRTDDRM
jgi:hypothetical protein